jgi:hypothetical protein
MDRRATMASGKDDAAQRRREHWREVLRRWQSSGLSQAAFCRQRKLPVWRFTWWKKRLSNDGPAGNGLFVPISVAPSAASSADFELTLRGDRLLRFGADVPPARLAAIVAAIESVASPAPEGQPC